jgi:hypothetical protein
MNTKGKRLGGALLAGALTAALAVAPAQAQQINCWAGPTDAQGNHWAVNPDDASLGFIFGGRVGELLVGDEWFFSDDYNGCERQLGDRQVAFPAVSLATRWSEDETDVPPRVDVSRKVYVPVDGQPFARVFDRITNPNDEELTFTVQYVSDLPGDVMATSSGDTELSGEDTWATIEGYYGPELVRAARDVEPQGRIEDLPAWTTLWDGQGGALDASEISWDGDVYASYELTLAAGETAALMHIENQSINPAAGEAFAARNAAGHAEFLAGLTADELAALRNWGDDVDGDGARNAVDNCLGASNANQADLDRDGQGDACDADRDGDNLPDAVEADLGTNPSTADSDGDGIADRRDACPTKAGAGDGCPAGTVVTEPRTGAGDAASSANSFFARLTPDGVTAKLTKVLRRGRYHTTVTGTVRPPAGLSVERACGAGEVEVVLKAGRKTVSRRAVELGADCAYKSTARVSKSRVGKKKTLKAIAYFLGNDAMARRASN